MKISSKAPHELSEEYYQFVDAFTQTDFEDEKILGKFYTDSDIAASMMRVLSQYYVYDTFSSELRIIDPFCGDGRLISDILYQAVALTFGRSPLRHLLQNSRQAL